MLASPVIISSVEPDKSGLSSTKITASNSMSYSHRSPTFQVTILASCEDDSVARTEGASNIVGTELIPKRMKITSEVNALATLWPDRSGK